jgi:transposase
MRTGISITLKPSDRRRLAALARDRNAPHKHVWRAEIVLLSANGVGTHEIMRRTGKSKTCVWRWQERFMQAGYDGLLRDKTRPSRIPPLGSDIAERVVALTRTDPPVEATHWTASRQQGRDHSTPGMGRRRRRFSSVPGREPFGLTHSDKGGLPRRPLCPDQASFEGVRDGASTQTQEYQARAIVSGER